MLLLINSIVFKEETTVSALRLYKLSLKDNKAT